MRTYTSTNVEVEYPSYLVFLLDNNFVKAVNIYGNYKLHVKITLTAGGIVTIYENTSEIGIITFRLTPYLRGLASGTTVAMLCEMTTYDANSNQYIEIFKADMKMVYGKTLQERHHGSEEVVVYETLADLQPLQVFKPEGWKGDIIFDSNILSITYDEANIINITCNPPGQIAARYDGVTEVYRGDVWDEAKVAKYNIRCVQVCPAKNGIKLTYYNTDGCKRYAIGEVLKKTMAAERKEYRQGGYVYDEPPRSLVTGYTGTIDVGFTDVEPGQYIEDIMLSPVVTTTRGADTISVIPTTLQLVRDGKTKDMIITFKIDA